MRFINTGLDKNSCRYNTMFSGIGRYCYAFIPSSDCSSSSSLSSAHRSGAGIGELICRYSARYRCVIIENLKQAGIIADNAFLDRIGRASGRQALEGIWVWYRPAVDVLKRVTISDQTSAMIGGLMRSNRPIVFMMPHVGCFEVLPVWLAATFFKETGRNISILFRPPKYSVLRKLVGDARQAPGIEVCPTTVVGVKKIIRNFRA